MSQINQMLAGLTPEMKRVIATMPEPMAVQLVQQMAQQTPQAPQSPETPPLQSPYKAGMGPSPLQAPWTDGDAPAHFRQSAPGPQGVPPEVLRGQNYDDITKSMAGGAIGFNEATQNGIDGQGAFNERYLPDSQPDPNLMEGVGQHPGGMFWQEDALQGGAGQSTAIGQQANDTLSSLSQPLALGEDNTARRRIEDREQKLRNGVNGLQAVLDQIQRNPELLDNAHTMTGRAQMGLLKLRDRSGIDMFDIGPEQEKAVGDTAQYRQLLLTNVNQYIKDITGAQVGQGQETTRLMAVQPNENDSPSELVAKLQGAIDMGRINTARMMMARKNPGAEQMTDSQIREQLGGMGRQFYEDAVRAGLSPTEARMQAAQRLSQEYGL